MTHDIRVPARARLPQRREAETIDFAYAGQNYTATTGFYRDGRLGEVFTSCAKRSSSSDAIAKGAPAQRPLCLSLV